MRKTPLRSRSAPLRSREPARGKPIKRKKRTPSEFARIYGSKERVAWVKSLGCIVCLGIAPVFYVATRGTSHNAHTANGGRGRKADYTTIVPLCASHHRCFDEHQHPLDTDEARQYVKDFAPRIEVLWQSHLRQTGRARQQENE